MRGSLNRILRNCGCGSRPVKAFTDWPMLEQTALKFVAYVTPWLVVGGESLAEATLRDAIRSYDSTLHLGYEASHRKFVERLAESARTLSALRISVKDAEGQWAVWSYDEPLTTYLQSHKRSSLLIRERDTPVAFGPVMIKLLAAITSTRGLEVAGLDLPSLLDTVESPT